MMEKCIPFQVPASITKIQTLARGLRVIIDTQEVLTPKDIETLFNLYNQLGWFTFSVHQVEAENLIDLPEIKVDSNKSPSQRLRAVLYRLWEQDNHNYDAFDNFYLWYMEKLIDKMKEKLT